MDAILTLEHPTVSIMALNIVRDIISSIEKAKYFTIMADEVTDSSNKEQVICFRSVNDQFVCHEDFIGLYSSRHTGYSIRNIEAIEIFSKTRYYICMSQNGYCTCNTWIPYHVSNSLDCACCFIAEYMVFQALWEM